mmetsp:Transcript_46125/g.149814  ORF Transcript_46125/g.149814 Transcript_46125/m.149814 type:complete len:484 (-) Transcript_46125:547-1998(-)
MRAQPGGGALLPPHRADGAGRPALAGGGGPVVLHVHPAGGRRADGGAVRVRRRRVVRAARAGRLQLWRDRARLGSDRALPRAGNGARAELARGWRQEALLRPRVFHARPRPGRGGGARAAKLLRRRRHELDRHPHRRRRRPRPRPQHCARPRRRRHDGDAARPLPAPPGDARVPRRSRRRVARQGLQVPLPSPADGDGATHPPLAATRAARRTRRLLPRRLRLGGSRLVRRRWPHARLGRAALGPPPRVVWLVGGGAHGVPRGGGALRHVVHVQVPRAGPRRWPAPRLARDGARGRPGRRHHVYADALAARHTRGGPHRHQAAAAPGRLWRRRRRRGGLPRGRHRHRPQARRDAAAPGHRGPRRRPRRRTRRDRQRRHGRARADQLAGATLARAARRPHVCGRVGRGVPLPRGAARRHRLCARARHTHHLRRRAGVRALCACRVGGTRVRGHRRSRRAARASACRPQGSRLAPPREGVPRLRP